MLLPTIINQFVRPGIIKIQYRSFKTDTIWPTIFVRQQTAALAAGAQNKLWNYIETFYHEQGHEYTPTQPRTTSPTLPAKSPD